MNEVTISRTVVIVNPQGMHLRPADLFARLASKYEARVEVAKGNVVRDGKSILDLATLVAECGSELRICACGRDAQEAITALALLVEQGFDEMEEAASNEAAKSPENSANTSQSEERE